MFLAQRYYLPHMHNIVHLQYILHLTYTPRCRKVVIEGSPLTLFSVRSGIIQTT